MRLIYIVSLLIFIVRNVRCYFLPISEDTGKALDGVISVIKSSLPQCFDFFQSKVEPLPEPSYWDKITRIIGYKREQEIESIEEPLLLCNSFILALLAITLLIYFSISKHFLLSITRKKPPETNIPFLCDDDDETEPGSDVDSSLHFTGSCGKCNCTRFLLGKGDAR